MQVKEHAIKFIFQISFMLSYNLIYLKIMKEEEKKPPKIIIKMNRTEHLPDVQALHLPFILPDVWHFFSF